MRAASKLLPVVSSTMSAVTKPNMATRPFTTSGTAPSTAKRSMASAPRALSRRPVPAGPGPGPGSRDARERSFSASISAQSFADNRSGPRGSAGGGAGGSLPSSSSRAPTRAPPKSRRRSGAGDLCASSTDGPSPPPAARVGRGSGRRGWRGRRGGNRGETRETRASCPSRERGYVGERDPK